MSEVERKARKALSHRAWRHRLKADDLLDMLKAQDYRCLICQRPLSKTWVIDHDHSCCPGPGDYQRCGRCMRGILCRACNNGLGQFGDSVEMLLRAVDYLQSRGIIRVEASQGITR